MYQFSDSESTDSEDGIRFKTDSTRHKDKNKVDRQKQEDRKYRSSRDRHSVKYRRSDSPHYRRNHDRRKERSRGRSSSGSPSRSRSPKSKSKRRDKQEKKYKDYYDRDRRGSHVSSCKDKNVERAEGTKEIERVSFGPTLPPHLMKANVADKSESKKVILGKSKSESNLDTLQQSDISVPNLSKHPVSSSTLESKTNSTSNVIDTMIGPTLPPSLHDESKDDDNVKRIGPTLPPHLREKLAENTEQLDEDVYGPVPLDTVYKSEAHVALEERALQMKIDRLNSKSNDVKVDREEWMLELPEVRASNLGLGPRQFRAKPAPDLSDRSSWTATPQDKAKKATEKVETKINLKKQNELEEVRKRDKEQEDMIKAHKKKKKEKSLLDIHRDKLKMKKKEGGEMSVRRPFDRDIDLKVNNFDDAQKKAVLKKAQLLDTRFSPGQSKFL